MLDTIAVLSAAPFTQYSIVVLQENVELFYEIFFGYQVVDKCKQLVQKYNISKIIVVGPSTYIPNVIDKLSSGLGSDVIVVGGNGEITN